MTIRGVFREVAAAQRRAARNEERRQRLHVRAMKLQAKANELECAAAEVEAFDERRQQLTSIHHTVGEAVDWKVISSRPAPDEPQKVPRREEEAVRAREQFRASFWQRILGKEEKLRAQLEIDVRDAQQRDEMSYQAALKVYRQERDEWSELSRLANAILRGETQAYCEAIEALEPLAEMQEIGCEFEVAFPDAWTVEIALKVESDKVVPRESKSLTRGGKLSVKAVPQAKLHELYQDYVCGCVLRTGRELFSFLPVERIVVNVNATLLDSATGHLREQTILSVAMPRATLEQLNFAALDPSDAMRVFPHRMGFKRSQGFSAISPLAPSEYPNATSPHT